MSSEPDSASENSPAASQNQETTTPEKIVPSVQIPGKNPSSFPIRLHDIVQARKGKLRVEFIKEAPEGVKRPSFDEPLNYKADYSGPASGSDLSPLRLLKREITRTIKELYIVAQMPYGRVAIAIALFIFLLIGCWIGSHVGSK